MSYERALQAAGATVHEFEQFGDYQGTWVAKVTYNGETGFVSGSYGSCSGCDSFEAEFGYENEETPERLADFGRPYLEGLAVDPATILKECDESSKWDEDSKSVAKWIRARA